jgi:hypothetical protein
VDKLRALGRPERYRHTMRWDNLFDDLEGQLEHELHTEKNDLRAAEERLRLACLSLRDRLVAVAGSAPRGTSAPLRVTLIGGRVIVIRPRTFGKDWLSADLVEEAAAQCILPLTAVCGVVLTAEQVEDSLERGTGSLERGTGSLERGTGSLERGTGSLERGEKRGSAKPVTDRIGLVFVLRDLCRRRSFVELFTTVGTFQGTIDRVGRDHCDVAVHEPGVARRATTVSQYRVVSISQLMLVRL